MNPAPRSNASQDDGHAQPDNAPAGPRIWRKLGWIALAVIVWGYCLIALVPWQPGFVYLDTPDHSWTLVLHVAYLSKMAFGREIVFTYGPMGFMAGGFHPSTYIAQLLGRSLLAVAFFCGIWITARHMTRSLWRAAGWLVVVAILTSVFAVFLDMLVLMLCVLLLCMHFGMSGRAARVGSLLLCSALALAGLIKFSFLVAAGPVLLVIALDEIARLRRPPWALLCYGLFVGVFWKLAGQRLGDFGRYLLISFQVAQGYTEAMSMDGMKHAWLELALFWTTAGLLLGLAAYAQRRQGRRWGFLPVVGLAGWVWIVCKAGYVRHDVHAIIACSSLLLAAIILCAAWLRTLSLWKWRLAWIVAIAMPAALTWWTYQRYWPCSVTTEAAQRLRDQVPQSAAAAVALPRNLKPLRNAYAENLRNIQRQRRLPRLAGHVDVYPHNQGAVIAAGLEYAPRPVFQSYQANTAALARLNADYLAGDRAPDWVLFDIQTVDNRLPSMDDGLSWPQLLGHYDLTDASGTFLLFKHRQVPREVNLTPVSRIDVPFNQPIPLPGIEQGPIWAKIDVRPRFTHRLSSLLYKPPALFVRVTFRNGSERDFRIWTSIAAEGFLLSPLIDNRFAFVDMAGRSAADDLQSNTITRITLWTDTDHPGWYFRRHAAVSLFRVQFPPQEPPTTSLLQRLRNGVERADNPLQLLNGPNGEQRLLAHPVSSLRLPIAAGARTLQVRFGLFEGVWEKSDGVEFRISRVDASGQAERLWSHYLDPKSRQADQGTQQTEIPLRGSPDGFLRFETLPGPSSSWDWAYWSDIQVK